MNGDPADLSNLRDIVLPPPVPWWPPAPGWWAIGGGLALAALVAAILAVRRYRANAYRREAIRELDALPDVTGLMTLLKRAAMVAYGREAVASLSGSGFLAFLDRTGRMSEFASGPAQLLPELTYGRRAELSAEEIETVTAVARRWIRCHRAEETSRC